MRVQEIMNETVHTIAPGADADGAWQMMQTKGVRHLVVVDGSTVVGVLSDSDAGGRSGAKVRAGATVGDLMDRRVHALTRHDTVRRAANMMQEHLCGCLPVIEDKRLVGVVTVIDVLNVIGGGADRPAHNARAALHHRVAHRKAAAATGRW